MFQLRRRWTVLTGVVGVVAYLLNNYRIEGLDKIQLRQRSPSEIAARQNGGMDWRDDLLGELTGRALPPGIGSGGIPSASLVPNTSGTYVNAWADNSPAFPSTRPSAASPNTSASNLFPPQGNAPPPLLDSPMASFPLPTAGKASPSTLPQPELGVPTLPPAQGVEPSLGQLLSVNEKLAIWAENANGTPQPISGAINSNKRELRIASFHIHSLGSAKLAKPHVFEMLVRILRRFDVIALQGIQSSRDDILPLLVERLNQTDRNFDYMIGPRVGRGQPYEQFGFLFDTTRVETDRYALYTIDDPEDLIGREPLVAWFRTKGVATAEAFTFSLVNVNLDAANAARERQLLPNLINAIQQDGRGEDDWILLGDFAGGDAELAPLASLSARMALVGIPTDISGSQMLDEILFSGPATAEFTGKSGAFDYLRQFNLSYEQALEVSDHLPIWADFSILEGGDPGRIAPVSAR